MEDEDFIVEDAPEIAPEDGIEVLKAQLEAAKKDAEDARRLAAEKSREAAKKTNEAADAQWHAMENDRALIEGAMAEIERNDGILQQGLAQANAAGDYNRVAEIQREIMANADRMRQLETGRAAIVEKLAQPKPKAEEPVTDPVDYVASQLPPRSAEWVRAHPEFVRDPKKWMKLQGADQLARANDLKVDSPEYFEFVEQTLGLTGGRQVEQRGSVEQDDDPMSTAAAPTKRKESPPVAPVSTGGNSRDVAVLTKAEREAAEASGITYKQYAENKKALQEQGRLGTRH